MGLEVPRRTVPVSSSASVHRRSGGGGVVIQLDRFMYLGESFEEFRRNMRLIPQITMK